MSNWPEAPLVERTRRRSAHGRFFRQTRAYAPFCWEDVEWGARAWRNRSQCIFCPSSLAVHGHRETVAKYYTEPQVTRTFERNRTLFHLRNLDWIPSLEKQLLSLDPHTWQEMFQPSALATTIRACAAAFVANPDPSILLNRWRTRP